VSKTLRSLVDRAYLTSTGSGRGAVYRFSQIRATNPDDVFGPDSSTSTEPRSTITDGSSTISAVSSTPSEVAVEEVRDAMGRLIAAPYNRPFVDSLEAFVWCRGSAPAPVLGGSAASR